MISFKTVSPFLSLAAALTLLPNAANATIIGFETGGPIGGTGTNGTPYTESGYTLTSSGNPTQYHDDIFGPGFLNSDGSYIFGWCDTAA